MKRSLLNILSSISAGVMGGGCFLLFFVLMNGWDIPLRIILSIVIGIAGYISGLLLFPAKAKSFGDTTAETLHGIIEECRIKVKEIRSYELRVTKPSLKSDIEVLCITFDTILDGYKKQPKDISAFLNYYLDSAIRIIKKYIELSQMNIKTDEIENLMHKSESIISTLKDALTKQMENTMQDDFVDLDAEISVLEKTLKTEGL